MYKPQEIMAYVIYVSLPKCVMYKYRKVVSCNLMAACLHKHHLGFFVCLNQYAKPEHVR